MLDYGADSSVKSKSGSTALHLAIYAGSGDTVETLMRHPEVPKTFTKCSALEDDNPHYGRIHLVLNKTLTDDTSVKRAQIKTFLCLIQFC